MVQYYYRSELFLRASNTMSVLSLQLGWSTSTMIDSVMCKWENVGRDCTFVLAKMEILGVTHRIDGDTDCVV